MVLSTVMALANNRWVAKLTEQVLEVKAVNFSTDLTSGVQRNIVRGRNNWRFLCWSVSARDLDTFVSLYDEHLHQCAETTLATNEGLSGLKP